MLKHKRLNTFAVVLFSLSFAAFAHHFPVPHMPHHDPTLINTHYGMLTGVSEDGVTAYKGIPYAQPPVGELRWRDAQPAKPWQGVLAATDYGHDCMQEPFPSDAAPLGTEPAEDCLVLNVWKPTPASRHLRPVMVWIHGGGFVNGGSSPDVYDGRYFAQHGIVVVSFNYRLGRFGFFAHPALTRAHQDPVLGNYAFTDQILALKWVRDNIARFGGDPNEVTLVGESAGGGSIHTLLTSPLAQGLYHRVIIESGAGRVNIGDDRYLARTNKDGLSSAESVGETFAEQFDITGSDDSALAALRALPADDVVSGLNMATMNGAAYTGPIIDGRLILGDPQDLYRTGHGLSVPMMVGTTTNEIGFPSTEPETMEQALAVFGEHRYQLARIAYGVDDDTAPMDVMTQIAQDQGMVEPARFVMREAVKQRQPVFGYRFGYVADSVKGTGAGAAHATDIPFEFNTVASRYGDELTANDQAMAELMHQYWVNFIRFGDPNGYGLPYWTAFNPRYDNLMLFSNEGASASGMIRDPWKLRLDLIESIQN